MLHVSNLARDQLNFWPGLPRKGGNKGDSLTRISTLNQNMNTLLVLKFFARFARMKASSRAPSALSVALLLAMNKVPKLTCGGEVSKSWVEIMNKSI